MPKQTIPRFLPNKGIVLDKLEEFLLQNFSVYSRNMEFYNELLQGRLGLQKFSTTALPGAVLKFDQFWLYTPAGSWFFMICTQKDITYYDFPNSRFVFLNKIYHTGTIEVKTGELNKVYGTDTLWATNLKVGDYIKIGAGNLHTGATWYEIDTVNSNTLLTLKTNAPITTAGASYEGRKIFTGSTTNFWNTKTFQDDNLGTIWIATNGTDLPVYWDGEDQVVDLSGLPSGFKSARYIEVYKNRVLFAWTVEGNLNQPARERWSAPGNCLSWDDADLKDFIDEDSWITSIINFSNYHIVFKERKAYIGRPADPPYDFDFEKSTTCTGCYAGQSIIDMSDYLYYWGIDNHFYRWNLLREESISDLIFSWTKEFDPNLESSIFGWQVEYKNQLRWFVPHSDVDYHNFAVVFDYVEEILQIWEYEQEQACCSIGEYVNVEDLFCDDPVWGEYYVDEQEGYWDDRKFLEGAPIIVYGGYDGYVRKADQGIQDDSVDYTRLFRSVRDNFDMPDQYKRLARQEFWFEKEIAGAEVSIKLRRDDNELWDDETKTISLYHAAKDIIKDFVRWDKHARNFQIEISATNHFALLGYLNEIYPKRKVK